MKYLDEDEFQNSLLIIGFNRYCIPSSPLFILPHSPLLNVLLLPKFRFRYLHCLVWDSFATDGEKYFLIKFRTKIWKIFPFESCSYIWQKTPFTLLQHLVNKLWCSIFRVWSLPHLFHFQLFPDSSSCWRSTECRGPRWGDFQQDGRELWRKGDQVTQIRAALSTVT